MFEQSLLTQTGAQNKSAFLASFSAQIVLAGVLVLVPLISHEVLPAIALVNHLTLDYQPSAPKPIATTTTSHSVNQRPKPNPFRLPTEIPNTRPLSPLTPETLDDVPVFSPPGTSSVIGGTTLTRGESVIAVQPPPPKPAPAPTVQAQPEPTPIHVTSTIQAAKILKRVLPIFPALARTARIQGTVRLVGTIAKDGTIQNLQVISGHPILAQAAVDAVRQWIYKPTFLNGQPVEVIAPIEVTFTLQ